MIDPLLRRAAALDTCVISDALEREGIEGTLAGFRPVAAHRSFTGRAITVDLGFVGEADGATRHLATAALDAASSEHVIVVAHHGVTAVAGWGGILSRGGVRNGIAGVVVDGAVRDVDETRELGLAVHATAVTPRSARGVVVERAWGEPVDLQGLSVSPGDLVRADGSGVVIIPALAATAVLVAAEALAAREAGMVAAVRAGRPMSEVMGAGYERALAADAADAADAAGQPSQEPHQGDADSL